MALPDYTTLFAGTAKTWKSSGGDYAITLTSLTNTSAREGAKGDFYSATYGLPELLEIRFETAMNATATAGNTVELWIGESDNATAGNDNPANLTGADAALSSPSELKYQANLAGYLYVSNARTTNIQKTRMIYRPTCRYIIPLVVNLSGQTLSSTAGNHQIVITPYYRQIID